MFVHILHKDTLPPEDRLPYVELVLYLGDRGYPVIPTS